MHPGRLISGAFSCHQGKHQTMCGISFVCCMSETAIILLLLWVLLVSVCRDFKLLCSGNSDRNRKNGRLRKSITRTFSMTKVVNVGRRKPSNSLMKKPLKSLATNPVDDRGRIDVVSHIFRLALQRNRSIQVKSEKLSKLNEGGDQSDENRRHPSQQTKRTRNVAEVYDPVETENRSTINSMSLMN
jgi:hypothetical protein